MKVQPNPEQDAIFARFPFKRGKFNNKGRKHWQREADKLVVEMLVRASMVDSNSLIGALASHRLLELARAENPELFDEVLAERNACVEGMARVLNEFTSGDAR